MPKHTHTQLSKRWIHVFTGGKQTDSKGKEHNFTSSDLLSMVSNAQGSPAPHIVGHKVTTTTPSWSWSEKFRVKGNKLYAKMGDVVPAFEKAVKSKIYPNRSISLLPAENGGFKVRHIAWLGGAAPAVEGLESAFSVVEDDDDLALEFNEWDTSNGFDSLARMLGNVRDWFIENESLETANSVLPKWNIESVKRASDGTKPKQTRSFNQGNTVMPREYTEEEIKKIEDAAAKKASDTAESNFEAEKKKLEKQIKANNYAASLKSNQSFVDELVKPATGAAVISKAQSLGMAEFMTQLDTDAVSFEFSTEDDDEPATKKGAKWFKEFCASFDKKGLEFNKQHVKGEVETGDYVPSPAEIQDYAKKNGVSGAEASFALVEAQA